MMRGCSKGNLHTQQRRLTRSRITVKFHRKFHGKEPHQQELIIVNDSLKNIITHV